MSWSVSIIGEPDGVAAELQRESERQTGQCKVEFDAALPSLLALVRENFRVLKEHSRWAANPVLQLDASGSGTEKGGEQVARQVTVSLKTLANKLATVAVLIFACVLAGCQSAPQLSEQRGSESALQGGVNPVAPVTMPNHVAVGGSTSNVVLALPGVTGEPGKPLEVSIKTEVRVGADASGDVKGQGRQGSEQADSKTGTQTSTPTQTTNLDLSGVLKLAEDYLATVNPLSPAGKLATQAVAAAKGGDKAGAEKLLADAKLASKDAP